jgi:hypothetical protein
MLEKVKVGLTNRQKEIGTAARRTDNETAGKTDR